MNYDFKLKSSKSSSSSVNRPVKNINKKKHVIHKMKLYKNVIYCLKIKYDGNVAVRVYENGDYQKPLFRNTLTKKNVDSFAACIAQAGNLKTSPINLAQN